MLYHLHHTHTADVKPPHSHTHTLTHTHTPKQNTEATGVHHPSYNNTHTTMQDAAGVVVSR
jgi:hypothetical protein